MHRFASPMNQGVGRGVPLFRRRLRNTIAPPENTGQAFGVTSLTGTNIIVEFAWGANPNLDSTLWTWVDETAHVMLESGIQITTGRQDELSTASTSACSFVVDNSAGRFMPYLQTGPNWPNVVRNVPVRVSVDTGRTGVGPVVRFFGYATGFTPTWDTTGQAQALVSVTCGGALRRLEQGSKPLRSPLTRLISSAGIVGAYWPMEDDTGSVTLAEITGNGKPMAAGYGVTLAQGSNVPKGSASLVQLAQDGSLSSPIATTQAGTAHGAYFLINVPTYAGSANTTIMNLTLTGGTHASVTIFYGPTYLGTFPNQHPAVVARWLDASGNTQVETAVQVDYNNNTLYDKWWLVKLELSPSDYYYSDPVGTYRYMFEMFNLDDGITSGDTNGNPPSATNITAGYISKVSINATNALVGAVMGHLVTWISSPRRTLTGIENDTVYGAIDKAIVAYVQGTTAFPPRYNVEFDNESATTRLGRLCAEQGVSLTLRGSSNTLVGAQTIDTFGNLLRECETADGGLLYDGFTRGITYLARSQKYSQAAALTLDMTASPPQVSEPFGPVDDDQKSRNDYLVSRVSGSSAEYVDETGPLGTSAIGTYDSSVSLNVDTDDVLLNHASWLVHLGTVQGLRYPSFKVDLVAVPTLVDAWLNVDLGNRIDVLNASSAATQHPSGTVSLILEGYSEMLSPFTWTIEANCSPAEPWRAATIEPSADTSLAWRIDSAGSYLVADYAAGATSILVGVSDGYLWSTSAGDYPRDVSVGGTRVTVTAVSGSTSPQTFTITPVTSALRSGVDVALWSPPTIGL